MLELHSPRRPRQWHTHTDGIVSQRQHLDPPPIQSNVEHGVKMRVNVYTHDGTRVDQPLPYKNKVMKTNPNNKQ